jgi:hypothetical protein
LLARDSVIEARGERPRRPNFGGASRFLTMLMETAADAQEVSAAIERIADTVVAFILRSVSVHAEAWRWLMDRRENGRLRTQYMRCVVVKGRKRFLTRRVNGRTEVAFKKKRHGGSGEQRQGHESWG